MQGEIRNVSPVDLRSLPPVKVATTQDVHDAVARARKAQPGWEAMGFEARTKLLKKSARRLLERREECLELLHDEAGKTPGEALLGEAIGPLQYVSDWAKVARPRLKPKKLPIPALAFPRKKAWIEFLPRGVVAVIAPWNYPLANFFKPVFAALICGNSVVIKPSEYSPRTAKWFVDVMGEFLPEGVLQQTPGAREVGQDLVKAGVDAVTFTGSWASGKDVAALAAQQTIPCSVELGGKDAAIVLSDIEMDRTVAGIMHWSLHNAGQACGDIERVYVEEAIADEFVARLGRAVGALRSSSGDPASTDIGPLVHQAQLHVVEEHVRDAVARGAKIVCGGKRAGRGLWFEPTVLDGCDHTMKVMTEPTFGPVIPIVRVKDAAEAVRKVNDCEYGLNASVWSRDIARATELARKLEVGTAFVNNHAFTGALPAAPWTGVKKSGYGIANSEYALQHYTRPRTIVVDRKKSADGWWFPMNPDAEALGQALAEAQLGNVRAALKIPFLMSRRQKAAIQFVQGKYQVPAQVSKGLTRESFLARMIGTALRALGRFHLPLLAMERRWAIAVMNTMFTGNADGPTLKLLSQAESDAFVRDLHANLPANARLGSRVAIWATGLSPIYRLGKIKTIDRVNERDRLRILEGFYESDTYLFRQLTLLLKMNGSLSHAATVRFHEQLSLGAPATTGSEARKAAVASPSDDTSQARV